jgi:tetratricopeptide (TPR) repeat protein
MTSAVELEATPPGARQVEEDEPTLSVEDVVARALGSAAAGRAEEGEALLRCVLAQLAFAHSALASILFDKGDQEFALALATVAAELDPQPANVVAQAKLLYIAHRYGDTLAAGRRLAAACPGEAWPHVLMGAGLARSGDAPGALEHFERATNLDPTLRPAWEGLGLTLKELFRSAEAADALRRACDLDPGDEKVRGNLALALSEAGNVREALEVMAGGSAEEPPLSTRLFLLNCIENLDPAHVYREHIRWARTQEALVERSPAASLDGREARGRLRVAYLSPDFRGHSVAFFILPVIAAHDRREVEVIAYHERRLGDEHDHGREGA